MTLRSKRVLLFRAAMAMTAALALLMAASFRWSVSWYAPSRAASAWNARSGFLITSGSIFLDLKHGCRPFPSGWTIQARRSDFGFHPWIKVWKESWGETGARVPLWMPLAPVALLTGVVGWRVRRTFAPGCCPVCGYDLSDLRDRPCPECGRRPSFG